MLGVGNGFAVACNALLVQRGTFDMLRGRALTFVMSATYVLVGVGSGVGGALLHTTGPRWIWAGSAAAAVVAAGAAYVVARGIAGSGVEAPAGQPEVAALEPAAR